MSMRIVNQLLIKEYLDLPVSILEEYGMSYSCLNQLEDRFGVIWLRDLVDLTEEDLRKGWFGNFRIRMIRRTIQQFLKNREIDKRK